MLMSDGQKIMEGAAEDPVSNLQSAAVAGQRVHKNVPKYADFVHIFVPVISVAGLGSAVASLHSVLS